MVSRSIAILERSGRLALAGKLDLSRMDMCAIRGVRRFAVVVGFGGWGVVYQTSEEVRRSNFWRGPECCFVSCLVLELRAVICGVWGANGTCLGSGRWKELCFGSGKRVGNEYLSTPVWVWVWRLTEVSWIVNPGSALPSAGVYLGEVKGAVNDLGE